MPTLVIFGDGRAHKYMTEEVFEALALAASQGTADALQLENGVDDVGVLGLVPFSYGLNNPNLFIMAFASHNEEFADYAPLLGEWKASVKAALEKLRHAPVCREFFSAGLWRIEFQPMTMSGTWSDIPLGR